MFLYGSEHWNAIKQHEKMRGERLNLGYRQIDTWATDGYLDYRQIRGLETDT
jgi:hypothetical protein